MKHRLIRILCLLWLAWSGFSSAQSSCGFFDPKVTFADGSRACLSEFAFFSRKGLITSPEYADHLAVAKANSSSYAIATSATPERCPFVQFTAWNWAGQDAQEALPKCNQRMQEAAKKSSDYGNCRCEILIDSGVTKLSRADLQRRLGSFEHFLTTGITQEQTKLAEQRKAEEALAKAKQAEEDRLAAAKKEAQEKERIEQAKRDDERRRAEQAAKPPVVVAAPLPVPSKDPKPPSQPVLAYRKALVIGNDAYRHVEPLKNAREDARAIAASLQRVGYTVTMRTDLAEREMKAAIRNFAEKVEGGDEVAFFFAGHGVEIGSTNYLIPVDITGESPKQIRDEAIDLKRILEDVQERRAKLTLAIIDACRDNPFKSKWGTRTLGADSRGLAPTTPATGQMIIYSAGVGQKALDTLGDRDTSKNGIFTRVFIEQMQRPSVPIDKIARDTRSEVVRLARTIGHEQVPAIYDQVIGEFFFIR